MTRSFLALERMLWCEVLASGFVTMLQREHARVCEPMNRQLLYHEKGLQDCRLSLGPRASGSGLSATRYADAEQRLSENGSEATNRVRICRPPMPQPYGSATATGCRAALRRTRPVRYPQAVDDQPCNRHRVTLRARTGRGETPDREPFRNVLA
jgi:hypothetical protein